MRVLATRGIGPCRKRSLFTTQPSAKKAVMAITGLVMFGFVIGHMLGNLQVFLGPEKLNGYAKALHDMPPLLWGTRVVLLTSVVLHIVSAYQLVVARSMAARPTPYKRSTRHATNYAALTMKFSGLTLLLFIVFHLAHFTVPGTGLGQYTHSATNVYGNVTSSFQVPWLAAIYIVAQLSVGFHLYHGAWSMLQSLGLNHPRYNARSKAAAQALGLFVTIGNISMPLAIVTGLVGS